MGPIATAVERPSHERSDLMFLAATSLVRAEPEMGEAAIGKWKEARLLKQSVLKALFATIEQALQLLSRIPPWRRVLPNARPRHARVHPPLTPLLS